MKEKITMTKTTELTVDDAFQLFLRKVKVRNLSERTIKTYQHHYNMFAVFYNVTNKISDITIDTDELSDITWIQVFQVMLQMFRKLLSHDFELSDDKIYELMDAFMSAIPSALKERLQVA